MADSEKHKKEKQEQLCIFSLISDFSISSYFIFYFFC